MRRRKQLILALLSLLVTGCHGSPDNSQNHVATAQSSTASPGRSAASMGGSGDAIRVNFTDAATSAEARTKAPTHPRDFVFERGRDLDLPSKPTSGTRKQVAHAGSAAPQRPGIPFCDLATSLCVPFDGIDQAAAPGGPPDPNAAVGAGNIVEVVNGLMQVTDRRGAVQCKAPVTLQRFLRTTDSLTDPHVQFDNVNQRFIFVVTVSPPVSASAEPAMWVAISETEDPCGNWFPYRLTFQGDAAAKGRLLDFPMLGQDTHAILISTRTCDSPHWTNCDKYMIYGLPKSIVYTGAHVEFNCFEVDSLTAPVTNAGQPMIDSPVSFFLAAVPGTGYKLYRLTNSGGAGATLSKTTISAPFLAPSRAVNQPNTGATLNSSDGNITSSPYFDGTFIWFVHDGDDDKFPTVRYGKLDTGSNTVETTWAFHSGSSDDFNPSLTVGITPSGETVYLNWAFTDTKANTPTTPVFAFGDASKPLVTIAGAGTIYGPGTAASGVTPQCTDNSSPPKKTSCRFGDFSSVSLDPSVNGCAFATQEYFDTGGNWKTRITPIGNCETAVVAHPP